MQALQVRKAAVLDYKVSDDPDTMSLKSVIFTKDGDPDLDGDTYDKDIVVTEVEPLPMLPMHDRRQLPVGKVEDVDTSKNIATTEGVIYRNVSKGGDIAILIEKGLIDAVSIGFRALKYEIVRDDDLPWGIGYNYKEIELQEISIVDEPAVPEARITEYKQKTKAERDTLRELYAVTRELQSYMARI